MGNIKRIIPCKKWLLFCCSTFFCGHASKPLPCRADLPTRVHMPQNWQIGRNRQNLLPCLPIKWAFILSKTCLLRPCGETIFRTVQICGKIGNAAEPSIVSYRLADVVSLQPLLRIMAVLPFCHLYCQSDATRQLGFLTHSVPVTLRPHTEIPFIFYFFPLIHTIFFLPVFLISYSTPYWSWVYTG